MQRRIHNILRGGDSSSDLEEQVHEQGGVQEIDVKEAVKHAKEYLDPLQRLMAEQGVTDDFDPQLASDEERDSSTSSISLSLPQTLSDFGRSPAKVSSSRISWRPPSEGEDSSAFWEDISQALDDRGDRAI